jgi:replicative DNA helicase
VAVANDLGPEPGYPPAEFDRQPPQDIAAEQAVLGGMLLSKDAIADVVETLRVGDFYRPAHQVIYDTVLDLYGRGEPADPVTVSAELTRSGQLMRVGGAPYLHTLMSSVPTAANAGYYAQIVAERAVLRRLIEAGTRIVQLGYGAAGGSGGEVDEVVDRAQAAVYEVTEKRLSEDYQRLEQLLTETMDEIDLISSRGGVSNGVPTGFADLDQLTNGLHPGQMVIVAARPALGKALALDTPLPTPTGWTTMGEVAVGDTVIGADGAPTRVVAATEVMRGRPCFAVRFSDGTSVVTDAEHQWLTEPWSSRRPAQHAAAGCHGDRSRPAPAAVRTTREIAAALRCHGAETGGSHAVRNAEPMDLPDRDLPAPPYALGAWLGGGDCLSARAPTADPEILSYLEAEGPLTAAVLRATGVLADKHIPTAYLRASQRQRRALLAGLLDTGATVTPTGSVRFAATNRRLAEDTEELIVSLGYCCRGTVEPVRGRRVRPATAYTITFTPLDEVFRLERQRLVHKERVAARADRRVDLRYITDVRAVDSVPVRCLQVDHPDHLYLASRSMIPTHNSTLALDLARSCSIKGGQPAVIFSLEMGRTEITMRLLSAEAKVPLHHMRSGRMSDEDWARLARRMGEVADAPLYIDDSPNLTLMEIRAKARRLKQRHDLKLVVVDYLQLMTSPRRVESRQQEVSEFSRALKLLAKELEVPVVALSQLNRGPEQRTDKKPLLSDLRESGCLTAETRVLRADTGAESTLGELLASGAREVPVWSLDDQLRLVARTMTRVFPSGTREVFRLRLASGRTVTATANHPFLSQHGWRPLAELARGSRVGTLRYLPAPLETRSWPEAEVIALARRLADGSSSEPGSQERAVPEAVFGLPTPQLGLFVRLLWAGAGSARCAEPAGQARLCYPSTSRRLVEDVARLLLRFGVVGRLRTVRTPGGPDCHHLHIDGVADPEMPATNDVCNDIYWDTVTALDSLGERPVYDATVPGTHNFVADGVAVHNSLEQDADMVILLHREDAYEKESPRAGEADLILAKNRNGPTGTVTVAFQGHYSRFVDMQRG